MTQPATQRTRPHRHPVATAVLVVVFWMVAAVLVLEAHLEIEPRLPRIGTAAPIVALLVTSFIYTRLAARQAGVTHALGVGIVWLTLSIAVDIALMRIGGPDSIVLLGSSDRPLPRYIVLFAWIFSPALFARRPFLRER